MCANTDPISPIPIATTCLFIFDSFFTAENTEFRRVSQKQEPQMNADEHRCESTSRQVGFTLRNSAVKAFDSDFDSIAEAAKRLDELRNNWLYPPEWIERIPEVVPGYPDRIIAKPGHEADLKKRTLTNYSGPRI